MTLSSCILITIPVCISAILMQTYFDSRKYKRIPHLIVLLSFLFPTLSHAQYIDNENCRISFNLKSATKLFSVLLASKRPLITELADKLRLKYPLLPTISPCPTMRLEAIRSIIPISCRRYPNDAFRQCSS